MRRCDRLPGFRQLTSLAIVDEHGSSWIVAGGLGAEGTAAARVNSAASQHALALRMSMSTPE